MVPQGNDSLFLCDCRRYFAGCGNEPLYDLFLSLIHISDRVKIEYILIVTGILFIIGTVFLIRDREIKKALQMENER